ncbi:uncharacterized protein LOC131156074 [Malania oleifera]|uniref:uncharacterized protein LOC131156074 n=1 Tax=Malania oleifera TaxID=397392 RepID=UPI0025AE11E6|nr:uncharacterized protein LOC131156074 [Malania oleifera]
MKKDPKEHNCPPAGQGCSIKEFMRMNPLAFIGGLDPVAAKNWVQEIEEIIVVLDSTDEQKVCYTAFKMIGEVKHWWIFVKYFPSSVIEEKIEEFTNLTQGDMTVAEYVAKFVELSWFAPFLVPNEARKARKFDKGLRHGIYELLVVFQV